MHSITQKRDSKPIMGTEQFALVYQLRYIIDEYGNQSLQLEILKGTKKRAEQLNVHVHNMQVQEMPIR